MENIDEKGFDLILVAVPASTMKGANISRIFTEEAKALTYTAVFIREKYVVEDVEMNWISGKWKNHFEKFVLKLSEPLRLALIKKYNIKP